MPARGILIMHRRDTLFAPGPAFPFSAPCFKRCRLGETGRA